MTLVLEKCLGTKVRTESASLGSWEVTFSMIWSEEVEDKEDKDGDGKDGVLSWVGTIVFASQSRNV